MTISQIGPHRVRHGSVMDSLDELMGAEKADLIYSDPPWGQGNVKYWQTINKKMTGSEPVDIDFDEFLGRLFEVYRKYAKNLVLIEYGKRWHDQFLGLADRSGFKCLGEVEMVYDSKNLPLDFFVLAKTPIALPKGYFEGIYHTKGMASLRASVPSLLHSGNLVLDPCCGMGYTAQISVDNNAIFRGNELNEARLEKTKARLQKARQ